MRIDASKRTENASKTHAFKRQNWARAVISNSTPWKKVASIKKYIEVAGMLKNVETANSVNNYKIILSEAANSQKRALLKTIVGIIVGIVIIRKI